MKLRIGRLFKKSAHLDELKRKVATAEPPIYVVPCSEKEIRALEKQLNLKFPAAYREFLRWMGKDGGPFLRGSDCFYKDLPNIQMWAVERLEESHFPKSLPDDAFVFYMHQGYQFAFLRLSEGDDSPVYYFHEMHEQQDFVIIYDGYTDCLTATVEPSLEYWREHPNWYQMK